MDAKQSSIEVPVRLEVEPLKAIRLLCSQVGFAIDNYLLEIERSRCCEQYPDCLHVVQDGEARAISFGWLRACAECGKLQDWQMEDGSYICHACGAVSNQDSRASE